MVYRRHQSSQGNTEWEFVAGKAHVAPINSVATVSRMELTAGVTAVSLAASVQSELQYDTTVSFYTDSEAVLKFLSNESQRQTVFVSNRVRLIRTRTKLQQCHHVTTDLNPADVGSRGLSPLAFTLDKNWLYGPRYLPDVSEEYARVFTVEVSSEQKEKPDQQDRAESIECFIHALSS